MSDICLMISSAIDIARIRKGALELYAIIEEKHDYKIDYDELTINLGIAGQQWDKTSVLQRALFCGTHIVELRESKSYYIDSTFLTGIYAELANLSGKEFGEVLSGRLVKLCGIYGLDDHDFNGVTRMAGLEMSVLLGVFEKAQKRKKGVLTVVY